MQKERIIGTIIGVIFSVLLIFIGFWKTLLIGLGAYIGFTLSGDKVEYTKKIIAIIEKLLSLESEYLGILFGIIIATLLLNIGLFKTIFIGIFAFLGYYFVKKFSNKQEFFEYLDKILPPGKN